MTSWQESSEVDLEQAQPAEDLQDASHQGTQAGASRRRERPLPNPALDPRLVQLERRSRQPSRANDMTLVIIAAAAFFFGIIIHFIVFQSVLDSASSSSSSTAVEVTATPDDSDEGDANLTPTAEARPTATALPDRTSCEEIRGTQYRSVTEREFFLENCTS